MREASVDDQSGMTADTAHRALLAAIGEGRFELVAGLSEEYKQYVKRSLASGGAMTTAAQLDEILKPLCAARHLLCLVRAHQSARFQKLAVEGLYQRSAPASKGRTLDVDA
jgi:hypothetical protein